MLVLPPKLTYDEAPACAGTAIVLRSMRGSEQRSNLKNDGFATNVSIRYT